MATNHHHHGSTESEIIHHHHHRNHMMRSSSGSFNYLSKEDMGELDQALFRFLDGQDQSATNRDQRQNSGLRPPTLNIFPSQPMHVDQLPAPSNSKVNEGLISPSTSASKKSSEQAMDHLSMNDASSPLEHTKRERNRRGPNSSSEHDGRKNRDPKTLRRLAQNREAARKSRLRRKAYVQQLEANRMRLTQLEQEIQKARSQGLYLGGPSLIGGGDQNLPSPMANVNSALFDMEYARWLDDHLQIVTDLRNAIADHLPENELHVLVDNCLSHYDQVMNLKCMIAKFDVFHLLSGTWMTPAERCFLWVGGFRPSELIKIIVREVEPLTEQQLMRICGLQQSTHEAEVALSQGLDSMYHSLSQAVISDSLAAPPNMNSYMSQMVIAINNLSNLEAFIRQAENLRHESLHQLHQILTTSQAARCLVAIAEYFQRLRALSSLWLARPRQE